MPHVHVHVIPRYPADFGGDKDAMYPALESNEAGMGREMARDNAEDSRRFKAPRDEDRVARGEEAMTREASWLAGFMR